VLKRIDGPLDDTVPAHRPITVRDLLTFRMGCGLILGPQDQYPILQAASAQGIMVGPPKPPTRHAPDEWMRRFGTLPLMHQPGEKWLYNTGSRDLAPAPLAKRRTAVLADFTRYFGAQAANPLAYYEHSWGDDQWSRGAYGGYWTEGL
jgi:hypothetical protein